MNRRLPFAAGILLALGCVCTAFTRASETTTAASAASVAPTLQTSATTAGPAQASPIQAPSKAPLLCIPFRVREQDEIWVVSTRGLGCVGCGSPAVNYHVLKYSKQRWVNSTPSALYATDDPAVLTVFFLHGNRIDYQESLRDGLETYFQLVGRLSDERPVRFVVWSWPSDQIHGVLKDVRSKAARTDEEGYYFAKFMAGMSSDGEVGLVSYSLGGRIITGGLHLLGGGSLCGRYVPAGDRPTMRVAMWAAALHNDWLIPGRYHGNALPLADRWYIAINGCDPVLARYRALQKRTNPVALGYAGMWGTNLLSPSLRTRIEQEYVSNIVGKSHEREPYLYSPYIAARTRDTVLWQDRIESAKSQISNIKQIQMAKSE